MISIIPPQSPGEWLAWASALVTLLFGLLCFFTPRLSLRILRLRTADGVPEAVSESRATMAGFYLGTAIVAILFNQPFIWLVLGAGWAFTAIGRLVHRFRPRQYGFQLDFDHNRGAAGDRAIGLCARLRCLIRRKQAGFSLFCDKRRLWSCCAGEKHVLDGSQFADGVRLPYSIANRKYQQDQCVAHSRPASFRVRVE
jgi:hypothetical protein